MLKHTNTYKLQRYRHIEGNKTHIFFFNFLLAVRFDTIKLACKTRAFAEHEQTHKHIRFLFCVFYFIFVRFRWYMRLASSEQNKTIETKYTQNIKQNLISVDVCDAIRWAVNIIIIYNIYIYIANHLYVSCVQYIHRTELVGRWVGICKILSCAHALLVCVCISVSI